MRPRADLVAGGTRIAFGLGGTVATMKPDGSDVRRLPLTGFARVTSPAWSPDGHADRLLGGSRRDAATST